MTTDSATQHPADGIVGLAALILISPNLDKQREFYESTLGFEVSADYGDAVFLTCGDQTIALFGPTHHREGTERLSGSSHGISHLEFLLPEAAADAWHDRLVAAGHHAYGRNYEDADGNLFHFVPAP